MNKNFMSTSINDIIKAHKAGEISKEDIKSMLLALKKSLNFYEIPLNEGQKALWAIQTMIPESPAYNLPVCIEIQSCNFAVFEDAISLMTEKHPILKSRICENGSIPEKLMFESANNISVGFESLRGKGHKEAISRIKEVSKNTFNLTKDFLFKVHAFEIDDAKSWVLFNIHHIVFDGKSTVLFLNDLMDIYGSLLEKRTPLVSPSIGNYKTFFDAEFDLVSNYSGDRRLDYWRNNLKDHDASLDLLFPKTVENNRKFSEGETLSWCVNGDISKKIKLFCRECKVFLPAFFMAGYQILLAKYSGKNNITVGVPFDERSEKGIEDSIGFFVNMLPIRASINAFDGIKKTIISTQIAMLNAMQNSYPFARLVKALGIESNGESYPLFQVAFEYQDMYQGIKKDEGVFRILENFHQEGEYNLVLEVVERNDTFDLNLKYKPRLYNAATIEKISRHFSLLLERLVEDPEKPISEIQVIDDLEKDILLRKWNNTAAPYPINICLHEAFRQQVEKTPAQPAVTFKNATLSYKDLDSKSDIFAQSLLRYGVLVGGSVAICVDRSLDMLIAMLGILKIGANYIPLDPKYPDDRLSYIVSDSGSNIVVTQRHLESKVRELLGRSKAINSNIVLVDEELKNTRFNDRDFTNNNAAISADSLAYIIYTSGSTGNPKGVMISHRSLMNFLFSMAREPGIKQKETLLAVTTYCFDIAGLELFLPIIVGAHCHIADSDDAINVDKLKSLIAMTRPDVMQATPSTWKMLFHAGWENRENVKILCGGEALSESLKESFIKYGCEAWNLFGPTETTIWSTMSRIVPEKPISIGKPINNTETYVLDVYEQLQPIGLAGELCISGHGLAQGYLNRSDLTHEKFVDHPFKAGEKLYKTGDLVRWYDDGTLEYLGRIDQQIKIRGFRIELGEIEKRLNTYPGVMDAIVVKRDSSVGVEQLIAYVVWSQPITNEFSSDDIAAYLGGFLPVYMIPDFFVRVEEFPKTPNGKIDRNDLARRDIFAVIQQKDDGEISDIEYKLRDIWEAAVDVKNIDFSKGFFSVGGSSITAVVVAREISREFGIGFTVTDLFKHHSIKKIAQYIRETKPRELSPPCFSSEQVASEKFSGKNIGDINSPEYYKNSVAIIGMSCHLPGASNYIDYWKNLRDGKNCATFYSESDLKLAGVDEQLIGMKNFVPVKMVVDGKDLFDAEFFGISDKNGALMDPQFRSLLMHSWQAVEDSGYCVEDVPHTSVFMSASNSYYQAMLTYGGEVNESDDYVTWLLAQGGSIPTMVSYELGFKGPSVFVHTNCSSSLAALASAYQSICMNDASCALVGASTLLPHSKIGYVYEPGLNFSSDGFCRAFDERADGLVGGEGTAVLFLKNACDAIKDKDNIYALLRGVGLNNDGGEKSGFYAPSVQGQADVIKKVLESTGVNPRTIGYVEAHGTGTRLGDPIEVTALTEAYQRYTSDTQFCALGSVKPNIGHLDTAAGLAACIKTILSLKHREIPPTINFKTPNSKIAFEKTPFFVVGELQEWPQTPDPLRAAVSSFGIGGTNAHAIFEEAPRAIKEVTASPLSRIIPISARSEQQLKQYLEHIVRYLELNITNVCLEDFSYTLQVGRKSMRYRVAFVVDNLASALEKMKQELENYGESTACLRGNADSFSDGIKFFKNEASINDVLAQWRDNQGLKKIAEYWVEGGRFDWSRLYLGSFPQRISLPTYPFSLKKYGTLLKDNYRQNGNKSFTNENMYKSSVHPFIHRVEIEGGIHNFISTFDGSEFFLKDHVIGEDKIFPGVAYLEMVRRAAEIVSGKPVVALHDVVWTQPIVVNDIKTDVELKIFPTGGEFGFEVYSSTTSTKPQVLLHSQGRVDVREVNSNLPIKNLNIVEIKNRCSKKIASDEFYDYVREGGGKYGPGFQGVRVIHQGEAEVLAALELSESVRETNGQYFLHPGIMDVAFQITDSQIMQAEAKAGYLPFFVKTVVVYKETPLQGYAYIRLCNNHDNSREVVRYDIDILDEHGGVCVSLKEFSARQSIVTKELLLFQESWITSELAYQPSSQDVEDGKTIVILPSEWGGGKISHRFPDNYDVISFEDTLVWSAKNIERCFKVVYQCSKAAITKHTKYNTNILVLLEDTEEAQWPYSTLNGLFKTLRKESRYVRGKLIKVDRNTMVDADAVVQIVLSEATTNYEDIQVRYDRTMNREVRKINEIPTSSLPQSRDLTPVFSGGNGVYWITGGAGKVGLAIAKYLAEEFEANVILTGRSEHSDKIESDIGSTIRGHIEYMQSDVSSREDTDRTVSTIKVRYGNIRGVFHTAGLIKDSLIANKSSADIESVFAPKISGVINIDHATRNENLEFIILFSSVSGVFGNIGQADYAAANTFLDGYASYRNALVRRGEKCGKTISIAWPYWKDGGMDLSSQTIQLMQTRHGQYAIPNNVGLNALNIALNLEGDTYIPLYGDAKKIRKNYLVENYSKPEKPIDINVSTNGDSGWMLLASKAIVEIISTHMEIDRADVSGNKEFGDYGFDSISLTTLSNKLNNEYKLSESTVGPLVPTIFFEYPNISKFIDFLVTEYEDIFKERYISSNTQGRAESSPQDESKESVSYLGDVLIQRDGFKDKNQKQSENDIAIVGMSGCFPMARDTREFWKNLVSAKHCISEIPSDRWDWREYFGDPSKEENKTNIKWGGFIDGVGSFDPLFFRLSPKEAEGIDPHHRLLMTHIWLAIEDAGYAASDISGTNTAIFIGVGGSGYDSIIQKAGIGISGNSVLGMVGSIATSRMSHFLNLHGPSEPIDTACSSALVAVHRAVTGINCGDFDMALVGGVQTILTPHVHISFNKAGMLSQDGKCKTFSKHADGYVRGEGVGILFLKKLVDAERQGDDIYAVLKGTAENHGGRANTLTSPNPNAQKELLIKAYERAGIDPLSVGYIETHGTGTPLGDPVELNGLKSAFKSMTEGKATTAPYCGLGSVKTNIGHLELAAGVAGLIKVLLQIKHKTLVPSLHCDEINPYIQLDGSPFYIVREKNHWHPYTNEQGEKLPLRAGVSSFGFGGVNAHVVVEEYISQQRRSPDAELPGVFVLSAKNKEQLKVYAGNILKFLLDEKPVHSEEDLIALLYTYQVGRESMEDRLGIIVNSLRELTDALHQFVNTGSCFQGYRGRVTAKNIIEPTIEQKSLLFRKNYKELLDRWVKGEKIEWHLLYGHVTPRRVHLPAYPFEKEKYWVQSMPERQATFIVKSQLLHPMVHRNISTIEEVKFISNFDGSELFLNDHRVNGVKTLPGVAYLEMALQSISQALGDECKSICNIALKDIAWIRTMEFSDEPGRLETNAVVTKVMRDVSDNTVFEVVSDNKFTEKQVVHCRGSVIYERDSRQISLKMAHIDIEVIQKRMSGKTFTKNECYDLLSKEGFHYGPAHKGIEQVYLGQNEALAKISLPECVSENAGDYCIHPSLLDSALQVSVVLGSVKTEKQAGIFLPFALDRLDVMSSIGESLWAYIEESTTFPHSAVRKRNIYLYNEDGNLCALLSGLSARSNSDSVKTTRDIGAVLFRPVWQESRINSQTSYSDNIQHYVFLCGNFKESSEKIASLTGIQLTDFWSSDKEIDQLYVEQLVEILKITQSLLKSPINNNILIQVLIGNTNTDQILLALSGFLKTLATENPQVTGQVISLANSTSAEDIAVRLKENKSSNDVIVRYQDGKRYTPTLIELDIYNKSSEINLIPWKQGGVYLITGGCGELGNIFAHEIADSVSGAHIILLGRSTIGARQENRLRKLSEKSANAEYYCADLTKRDDIVQAIKSIAERYGAINGVIHCAGVLNDGYIYNKEIDTFKSVVTTKVQGTLNLDEACRGLSLDFFVGFSSVSAVFGSAGQGDYASANAFMDALAQYRSQEKVLHSITPNMFSINWPLWKSGGMNVDSVTIKRWRERTGIIPMGTEDGVDVFYKILSLASPQTIVYYGEKELIRKSIGAHENKTRENWSVSKITENQNKTPLRRVDENLAINWFKSTFSKVIKLPPYKIEEEEALEIYGIDSIMAMELTDELEKNFGSLSKTLFFEYQTTSQLCQYFIENHHDKLREILGLKQDKDSIGHRDIGIDKNQIDDSSRQINKGVKHFSQPPALVNRPRTTLNDQNALDIAIIGLSGKYPQSNTLEEFWDNLKNGKDAITEIPDNRWQWSEYFSEDRSLAGGHYSKWGGFISQIDMFDPLFFNISPRDASYMDPQERLFLEHAWSALEDAGYRRKDLWTGRTVNDLSMNGEVGVYAGVMYSEYQLYGREETLRGNPVALGGIYASIANRVSYVLNLHGPSMTVDTMCSSSLTTLHLACQDLRLGHIHMGIAGGVNLSLHPNKYQMLSAAQFISTRGHCESFGLGGDGYIPGEGVGVAVLKRLEDAQHDGDSIYGVIKGSALNHGGKTNGYNVPNPNAQQAVIEKALSQASIDPRAVSYIEAHGTGTKLGDPIEITGLNKVFSGCGESFNCTIGSVKSNIGHCESAAGIAGVTKVLLQMRHKKLVPSLHSRELNPNIDFSQSPFTVNQHLVNWEKPVIDGVEHPRVAGISSFGAGGSNAHIIIEEYQNSEEAPEIYAHTSYIFPLSARNEALLKTYAATLIDFIGSRSASGDDINLERLTYTYQIGREGMEHRLAILAHSVDELVEKLKAFVRGDQGIENVFTGSVSKNKDILSLFNSDIELRSVLSAWINQGKLAKLTDLWSKGLEFDWHLLHVGGTPKRINAPTYPFARERYWVPGISSASASVYVNKNSTEKNGKHLYLEKVWLPANDLKMAESKNKSEHSGVVLIFGTLNTKALHTNLFNNRSSIECVVLSHGEISGLNSDQIIDFYSLSSSQDTYSHLQKYLSQKRVLGFIDLTAWDVKYEQSCELERGKLLLIQKLIENYRTLSLNVLQVTCSLTKIDNYPVTMQGARLAGIYRMLGAEYKSLKVKTLDIAPSENGDRYVENSIEVEFFNDSQYASEISYRGEMRYIPRMVENFGHITDPKKNNIIYRELNVVVITGGSRGIGAEVANHIVDLGVKKLVITGRESLPRSTEWKAYIQKNKNSETTKKLEHLQGLLDKGVDLVYSNVDLTDKKQLKNLFSDVRKNLGGISAVFHCAGLVSPNPAFFKKEIYDIEQVYAPKVTGLTYLHEELAGDPMQLFLLFSSASSVVPMLGVGQSDYAGANAYMDSYAAFQVSQGNTYFKSIQWPLWSGTGIGTGLVVSRAYTDLGFEEISIAEGLALLDDVIQSENYVVLPSISTKSTINLESLFHNPGSESLVHEEDNGGSQIINEQTLEIQKGQFDEAALNWVKTLFIKELGLKEDQLNPDRPLDEYGAESIVIAQMSQTMEKKVGKSLPPSLLLEYSTIRALAEYFTNNHADIFHAVSVESIKETNSLLTVNSSLPKVNSDHYSMSIEKEKTSIATKTNASDIAVVGISCRLPGAPNRNAFWNLLQQGESAISELPSGRWERRSDKVDLGGWIDDIDLFDEKYFHIKSGDAAVMDPQARIILEESLNAIYDAGYQHEQISGKNIGVYIGGRGKVGANMDSILEAPNPILGLGQNYMATNISRFFNINGPSLVIDTACSSAITGMSIAVEALNAGKLDMAFVGGVSLLLDSVPHDVFSSRNILSKNGEFHIFDKKSNGEVLGEGAGVVLLKRLFDAERDGNKIYGVVKSIAVNNDGRTLGPGSPNIDAQKRLLSHALESAGKEPKEIGYIEVNGGGNAIVDSIEIKALSEVYKLNDISMPDCYIGSIKPNVGHLLLSSGIASFIRCVLSLHNKEIPPFISATDAFEYYDFDNSRVKFNRESISWKTPKGKKRVSAQSIFPDGGTNCHVIMEEFVGSEQYVQSYQSRPSPLMDKRVQTESAYKSEGGRSKNSQDREVNTLDFEFDSSPLNKILSRFKVEERQKNKISFWEEEK